MGFLVPRHLVKPMKKVEKNTKFDPGLKLTDIDVPLARLQARTCRGSQSLDKALAMPPTCPTAYRKRNWTVGRRIYWKGRQWMVTGFGIEAHCGCYYPIPFKRLFPPHHGPLLAWPDPECWLHHMAEKIWVDLDDFYAGLQWIVKNKGLLYREKRLRKKWLVHLEPQVKKPKSK